MSSKTRDHSTNVRQPQKRIDSEILENRRAANGISPDLNRAMSTAMGSGTRMLRIGDVVKRLRRSFRHLDLEDPLPRKTRAADAAAHARWLSPFTEDDLERLTTISRLQRDEFLPLRVIRDHLSMPGWQAQSGGARRASPSGWRRSTSMSSAAGPAYAGARKRSRGIRLLAHPVPATTSAIEERRRPLPWCAPS